MRETVDLKELERYLRLLQENPDSRIFAPLADLYRRMGRLHEAEEICREGIKRHPYYAGGKVALAQVMLDKGDYEESLHESESVVTYYPDNILARKIFIRSLAHLGQHARAQMEYETLKSVSPFMTHDREIEKLLQKLASGGPAHGSELPEHPFLEPLASHNNMNILSISESKTEEMPRPGAPLTDELRDKRLRSLHKRKLILETWLRRLGSDATLR